MLTWDPSLSDSDRERSKLRFGGWGRQEAVGKGMLRHVGGGHLANVRLDLPPTDSVGGKSVPYV